MAFPAPERDLWISCWPAISSFPIPPDWLRRKVNGFGAGLTFSRRSQSLWRIRWRQANTKSLNLSPGQEKPRCQEIKTFFWLQTLFAATASGESKQKQKTIG